MFLKSKSNIDWINTIHLIIQPRKVGQKTIGFDLINKKTLYWKYISENERNHEYEWILEQLDCRCNESDK